MAATSLPTASADPSDATAAADPSDATATSTTAGASAIARRLASCNPSVRDRAARFLVSSFLPASLSSVSDGDLLKIWKGLFFCFWHSDKPVYQSRLASLLASSLSSPAITGGAEIAGSGAAGRLLDAYLATVRREWGGIDALRLDKFYLLNRRFLHHLLLHLRSKSFDPDLTNHLISILSQRTLLSAGGGGDKCSARGLAYHVADVFLDELEPFLPLTLATLDLLLKPFFTVLEKSSDKVLVSKVKVGVFERFSENGAKFLAAAKAQEGAAVAGSDIEKFGKVGLLMGFSKRFLELGAAPETVQANRKVLFGLRDAFLKLEKDFEKSGVKVSPPEFEGADPEIAIAENGEGSGEKKIAGKKRKKQKKNALDGGKKEKEDLKSKKKKKKEEEEELAVDPVDEGSTDDISNEDQADCPDAITFDEMLMSNLQKQFEKAAAEAGMVNGSCSLSAQQATPVNGKVAKKKRRAKSADKMDASIDASDGDDGTEGDKSVKKVRFSMKSNLVWKPHSPLPPHSLRLPPSATPRGSALKKGVQPGPIRETPTAVVKKTKLKAKSAKKNLKSTKSPSAAVKRLRKLQSFSA